MVFVRRPEVRVNGVPTGDIRGRDADSVADMIFKQDSDAMLIGGR